MINKYCHVKSCQSCYLHVVIKLLFQFLHSHLLSEFQLAAVHNRHLFLYLSQVRHANFQHLDSRSMTNLVFVFVIHSNTAKMTLCTILPCCFSSFFQNVKLKKKPLLPYGRVVSPSPLA